MYKDFKILFVGDLHLRDREKSSTKGMVEDSVLMLKRIIQKVVQDETIKLVIFLGDIQDTKPNNSNARVVVQWRKAFAMLDKIMRMRGRGLNITHIGLTEADKGKVKKGIYPALLTLKGNHDYARVLKVINGEENSTNKVVEGYTFYDELLELGYLANPKGIVIQTETQKMYLDFRNYSEASRELSTEYVEDCDTVIALVHDIVVHAESDAWISKVGTGIYNLEEVSKNVDVVIAGHVHKQLDPVIEDYSKSNIKKEVLYWQLGSMGRTSYSVDHIRDVGYCGTMDTSDIDLTNLEVIPLKLTPVAEYFKQGTKRAKEVQENAKETYLLDISGLEKRKTRTIQEEVEDRTVGKLKLKEYCLDILSRI